MRYSRSLDRRTFLRGAGGIAIGLPFLDEMRTSSVWAAPGAAPVRALNIFLGGGVPKVFQLGGLVGPLTPLAPLANKMAFVRGIQGPGGHVLGAGAAFVGQPLVNDTTVGGPSIDNEIMRFAYPMGKPPTPIAVQGAGCYFKFLDNPSRWVHSWDAQGHPAAGLVSDPKLLFANLFGAPPGGMTTPAPVGGMPAAPPQPTPDQKLATSILDTVVGQYQFYMSDASNLTMESRTKIANHLDAVRQLESRISGVSLISQSGSGKVMTCATPPAPGANLFVAVSRNGAAGGVVVPAADLVTSYKVMADTFAMGVACDLFRFGFMEICCAGDGVSLTGPYTVAGQVVDMSAAGESHTTNHSMTDNPTLGATATTHAGWYTHVWLECCSYMIQQLDKYVDANGQTILDNSFVLLGTDLGTNHAGDSVFYAMSKAGGKFKPGIYDVNGPLLAFLSSCKSAMGLGGTPTMTSFIA
jgi:Protein of unknown function (DUF1552)